jgi:antitoxin component YwqK of YwqJK toxin-antitoxin module
MKKSLLILWMIVFSFSIFAFNRKDINTSHKTVIVNTDTSQIVADVFTSNEFNPKKLRNTLEYSWYYKNKIKCTTGNYTGYLLDGSFICYDLKGNMLVKGTYKNGLKNGNWFHWTKSGKLRSIQSFKMGLLDGITQLFDSLGTLKSSIEYKSGIKTGISVNFNNGSLISEFKYKNDKIVSEKLFTEGKITKKTSYKNNGEIKKEKVYPSKNTSTQCKSKKSKIVTKNNEPKSEKSNFLRKIFGGEKKKI